LTTLPFQQHLSVVKTKILFVCGAFSWRVSI
jgi:hypothetical protein